MHVCIYGIAKKLPSTKERRKDASSKPKCKTSSTDNAL